MKKNARKFLTTLSMSAGVLCMLSFSACSTAENADEVDTETTGAAEGAVLEDDGMFDSNEFSTSFTGLNRYEEWDANDDNFLDENEFNDSYYDVWDTDNDGMLEENEWNDDVKNFGMMDEKWSDWDVNSDNQVDKNEFNTALDDNNYYSTWDADRNSQLTEREYTDGIFGLWDDNDDGFVEKERYDSYYNTYFGS